MNPYLKIGIAAVIATYLTPPIMNKFVVPQANTFSTEYAVAQGGITGLVTAAVFVVLGMATGGKAAA